MLSMRLVKKLYIIIARADDPTPNAVLINASPFETKVVDGNAFREALKPAYVAYSKEFGADNIKKIQDVR